MINIEMVIVDYILSGGFEILPQLCISDFTQQRPVIAAAMAIVNEGGIPDFLTVSERIKSVIDFVGSSYLESMDINAYIFQLKQQAEKERLKEFLVDQLKSIDSKPLDEVKALLHSTIRPNLTGRVSLKNVYDSERMLNVYLDHCSDLKKNMLTTGIHEIDNEIRGIAGGEVLQIWARPGCFKTAILMSIMRRYCKITGNNAIFFSLEMPVAGITERLYQNVFEFTGRETESFFQQTPPENMTKEYKFFVKQTRGFFTVPTRVTIDDAAKYVEIVEAKYGKVGLIGLDYMGLVDSPGTKSEYEANSKIATGAKIDLAKALNIPVIILSQLSRKGGDGSEEVFLDQARGSGVIEEAGDTIIGMWSKIEDDATCTRTELVAKILKARKGKIGSCWSLDIDPKYFRFGTSAVKWERPQPRKQQGYMA